MSAGIPVSRSGRRLAFDEAALQVAIQILDRSPYREDRTRVRQALKRLGLWSVYLERAAKARNNDL